MKRRFQNLRHLKQTASCVALVGALGLAACDDPAPPPPPPMPQETTDEFAELFEIIQTPDLDPARLTASPDSLQIRLKEGESITRQIRILNEGDETAAIESVFTGAALEELFLSGDCTDETVLERGQACEISINYEDLTGRSIETSIAIFSDAGDSRQLRIPLSIEIEEPPPPPVTEPVAPPPPPPRVQAPKRDPLADYLLAEQMKRNASGIGVHTLRKREEVRAGVERIERDHRYDPDLFESVETSMPVDRSRILTVDRVIKAHLIAPIFTAVDGPVHAEVSSHVYSPTGRNVLIPAGTRFVGRVAGQVDERAAIMWERFITPDGVSVRINAGSSDQQSRPGLPGHLDRRMWDRYGFPVLMSLLSAGSTYAAGGEETYSRQVGSDTEDRSRDASAAAADQLREDFEQIGRDILTELQDIRAVLEIPAGTMMDIWLTEDIYFKSHREVVVLNGQRYELPEEQLPARLRHSNPPALEARPTSSYGSPNSNPVVEIDGRRYELRPYVDENETRQPAPANQAPPEHRGMGRYYAPYPNAGDNQGQGNGQIGGSYTSGPSASNNGQGASFGNGQGNSQTNANGLEYASPSVAHGMFGSQPGEYLFPGYGRAPVNPAYPGTDPYYTPNQN